MKSPLRYPGGKTRARKILYDYVCEYFGNSICELYSPFFGGGSFELFLQEKSGCKIIANDYFKPLASFWQSFISNKDELCKEIKKKHPCLKSDFINYRNKIMNEDDILEQATMYYIINRCSFSGATLSGGFSETASKERFSQNQIKQIEDSKINNLDFHQLNFYDFINQYVPQSLTHNQLIFLDPPYYISSKLYGNKGDLHDNFKHEELAKILQNYNRWILCYNDCDFIRNLYKNYQIIPVKWSYGMNTSKNSNEIIIIKS